VLAWWLSHNGVVMALSHLRAHARAPMVERVATSRTNRFFWNMTIKLLSENLTINGGKQPSAWHC